MNAAEFLTSIGARFATPEEYAAAVKAVGEITRERDEARAFISDLVHMQSGAGWTRAMMREAAAEFLRERGLKPHAPKDTTPAFAMVADLRALLREAGEVVKPFANVAAHDVGRDETDADWLRPMEFYNRAARLTVGHLRRARAFLDKLENTDG